MMHVDESTTWTMRPLQSCFCGNLIPAHERGESPTGDHSLCQSELMENAEALLVKEWTELSFQEREKVQEQVHAVADYDAVEEDPEFVAHCLEQLDVEISKIRKKPAYDRANFLSPSYVKDRDFRLMFLRADDFHPRKAAYRIVLHFDVKQELFGLEKLGRPIVLDDIDQQELFEGQIQVLTEKDPRGRVVLFYGKMKSLLSQVQ